MSLRSRNPRRVLKPDQLSRASLADPLVEGMLMRGVALSRANYLKMSGYEGDPKYPLEGETGSGTTNEVPAAHTMLGNVARKRKLTGETFQMSHEQNSP
jgi:hypothetical protein